MKVFVLDSETANAIAQKGYKLKLFKDINDVPIFEFFYDEKNVKGEDSLDIGALEQANKIIVADRCSEIIYL